MKMRMTVRFSKKVKKKQNNNNNKKQQQTNPRGTPGSFIREALPRGPKSN